MSTLTWVLNTDLVNICRGRALPGHDPTEQIGPAIGWVPADLALDAFGDLVDNPWGPTGDLRLTPDPRTLVEVDPAPGRLPSFRFTLADVVETDGSSWPSCSRGIFSGVVDQLENEFGLQLLAATEHEFALIRDRVPVPFSVDAGRRAEPLLTTVVQALDQAGLGPENALPEFGHNQIELTVDPATGVDAADRSVMVREIVREVARALDQPITFSPVIGVGAGTNGAHLHFSLVDLDGRPRTTVPCRPCELSTVAGRFAAGILDHLPALVALTAPSVVSYLRLKPHSWSAGFTAYGVANREAALRLAPGRPPNSGRVPLGPSLEYRPIDATANPYLALAAVVTAGMDGLRRCLPPPPSVEVDPASLDDERRRAIGVELLPASLDEALVALEADELLLELLPPELRICWLSLKRSEWKRFHSASPREIVEAYADVY